MMQDMLDMLGVDRDAANRVRIAVTCLLHDHGGWWSTDCVVSQITRRWALPAGALTNLLAGMALAELAFDGHARTRTSTRGLLFSYIR